MAKLMNNPNFSLSCKNPAVCGGFLGILNSLFILIGDKVPLLGHFLLIQDQQELVLGQELPPSQEFQSHWLL